VEQTLKNSTTEYVDINKMLESARGMIGAKWRHQGRKPWAVDCIGLVIVAFKAGGITIRDHKNYGREPWKDGLDTHLTEHFGEKLPLKEMREGDIVVMKWPEQPAPAHVGIITNHPLGGFAVIHSYSQISVTEHRVDSGWLSLMCHIYRPQWFVNGET